MKATLSIQLRAAFLLIIFGLNMVTSFACSIGLDKVFNTSHHQKAVQKPVIHVHANGKKHEHHQSSVTHHKGKEESKKSKDNCCTEDALKFQRLDKNLNHNTKKSIGTPVLLLNVAIFLSCQTYIRVEELHLQTARYLFPPPPDILTSIQQFRI
ncbi:MAG TPA: hypothetical protein VFN30_11025 [Chitinophagaceae bacterium]|nr:hypothetical protein [Chitinophagaceae bacterium]